MGEDAVESDLFANGGLVFTDGSGDGSLGGAIRNAGEDDTAFLKGKVGKRIYSTHRDTCLSGGCQV